VQFTLNQIFVDLDFVKKTIEDRAHAIHHNWPQHIEL
jgi:hypothetical protein